MHVPVILFEYINRQPFLVQDHKPKKQLSSGFVLLTSFSYGNVVWYWTTVMWSINSHHIFMCGILANYNHCLVSANHCMNRINFLTISRFHVG